MYTNTRPGIGDQLYSGAAEVGKIRTTIGLIIAVIIGISFLLKKNVYTFKVSALIDSANCVQIASTRYTCDLKISYTYKGDRYPIEPAFFSINTSSNFPYAKGDLVDVFIDPNNPSDHSLESLQIDRIAGWLCVGFAVGIIGIAYLMRWLSQRYKFFAAAQGIEFGVDIIRN